MLRTGRLLILLPVASIAVTRSSPIHVILVAIRACNCRVHAHQRKYRVVIEQRGFPVHIRSLVALFAIGWEAGFSMIRTCRLFVILLMAGIAIGFTCAETLVYVTLIAAQAQMRRIQRHAGRCSVIEFRARP